MRHKLWFSLAVALQLAVLMVMIAMKWSTLAYGTKIMLETRPVDPWDLFRGDYVTLSYKISELDLHRIPADREGFKKNEKVYVTLRQQGKYWTADSVSHQRPSGDQLFIRGRVTYFWENERKVMLDYGINSYYVPQHQGRQIETEQRAVEVEASIDRWGNSALSRLLINGTEIKFE